jgi:hypothetical protein
MTLSPPARSLQKKKGAEHGLDFRKAYTQQLYYGP